jgi:hypothetical protein
MKTRLRMQPGEWRITVLFLVRAVFSVPAQDFTIDWFTTDDGGGKSTGGIYAVRHHRPAGCGHLDRRPLARQLQKGPRIGQFASLHPSASVHHHAS